MPYLLFNRFISYSHGSLLLSFSCLICYRREPFPLSQKKQRSSLIKRLHRTKNLKKFSQSRDQTTMLRCVISLPYSDKIPCAKNCICNLSPQVSALQADVKSLKANIEESTRNEQKALADCRTLQEAVKEMSSLESALKQKNSKIKSLEMEVRDSFTPQDQYPMPFIVQFSFFS